MALMDDIEADLMTIESDLNNQTFTWDGEDYVCIPGSLGELAALETGGFSVNIDFILKVRKSVFGSGVLPQEQDKVTFNNTGCRIYKVIKEPFSVFIKLILTDDSKGA